MSELKKCAMTAEKAIEQVKRCYSACGKMNSENEEFIDFVIESLRRALPENEPLTLEELRQMKESREPVWLDRSKQWVFIASIADAPYAQAWYFTTNGMANTVLYHHEIFYRRKLERSEG